MITIYPVPHATKVHKVSTEFEEYRAHTITPTLHPYFSVLPPLSLYVHFPWCIKKCPYCDFNSHEAKGGVNGEANIPEQQYLDALRLDLEHALPAIWGRKIYTIFIGGGTPSLLSAAGMDRLLSDLRCLLPIDGDVEITMEANPGTFEAEKFRAFKNSGINRLSLGVQSFNAEHLAALGRIHTGDEARQAIAFAKTHFDNFNVDLMYGLPNQTLDQARSDIQIAISSGAPHISAYQLTLEPNTLFSKYPPAVPNEDDCADMHEHIARWLMEAGFIHYEVSAYAKEHHASRHNLNYWQFGDYLGIGAGAHSKLSSPTTITREMRHKHPKAYMESVLEGQEVVESIEIGHKELPFEFMLNALRLTDGFPVNLFAERTGLSFTTIESSLQTAEKKGLIYRDHQRIMPTELGRRFLNDLVQIFMSG